MTGIENSRDLRVLISGAGIAGPALAFWLRRYGFTPTIVERATTFRGGGYMVDVWGVGYDLLVRMGLLESAREKAYIIDKVWFQNAAGKRISGFDADVFRRALAGRFFSIPRGDLARAIYDPIAAGVETLFGMSVQALQEDGDGVTAIFTNGTSRRFDLVIGADGLHSRIRECVFGSESQFEAYLGYYSASFLTVGYPHRDEQTYLSFGRPGRQVSRYALRDDQTAFLFVFAQDSKLNVAPHDVAAQKAILKSRFKDDGWECPEILARLDAADDLYFDAVSQVRMPRWSQGRVALIGDAAYCPSLLAGAGSAFAMLGAYMLAGELKKARGDHTIAFAAFEGAMRGFIEKEQKAAAGFAQSFAPKTAFGLFLRDRVLDTMRIPLLSDWIIRRFFANAFDLPEY